MRTSGIFVKFDVHSIRVLQKHAMRPPFPMLNINWVTPVQIFPVRHTSGISCPERPRIGVIEQTEGVGVLAQSVDIGVGRQPCFQTQVLPFKDEGCGGRVEEDFGG